MIKVRFGLFETNSSSTHTLTITSKKVFDEWKNDKWILLYDKKFVTEEEVEKEWQKPDSQRWYENYGEWRKYNALSYHDWCDHEDFTNYIDEYTTESGEVVVAFGLYGSTG